MGLMDHTVALFLVFLRHFRTVFHRDCTNLHPTNRVGEFSLPLHPLQHLFVDFLMTAILTCVGWYLIVVLICIFLIIGDSEHLFMCLLTICMSFLEKCLFSSSAHWVVCGVFLLLSCMSYLYILEIKPLWVKLFANIFSHPIGCLFSLFMVSFAVQKLVKFG